MTSDPLAPPEPASAVAVLGTGIMGSATARNLVAAGSAQDAISGAPVSGSKGPAETGQLLILASGRSARAGG